MGKCNKRVLNLLLMSKNSCSKKMKSFFKKPLTFQGILLDELGHAS